MITPADIAAAKAEIQRRKEPVTETWTITGEITSRTSYRLVWPWQK